MALSTDGQLQWEPMAPGGLVFLGRACLAVEPAARPGIAGVLADLQELASALTGEWDQKYLGPSLQFLNCQDCCLIGSTPGAVALAGASPVSTALPAPCVRSTSSPSMAACAGCGQMQSAPAGDCGKAEAAAAALGPQGARAAG